MPRGLTGATRPVQLEPIQEECEEDLLEIDPELLLDSDKEDSPSTEEETICKEERFEQPQSWQLKDTIDPPTSGASQQDSDGLLFVQKDKRIIVWEIKRNKLEQLEPIPQDLSDEAKKDHCIKNICKMLKSANNNKEVAGAIRTWMCQMETQEVVEHYNHLNSQLPMKNGWVTETNETLANVTGGSTNVILLGNTEQSKGALFCVAPYVCKNKVALGQCLTVLRNVQAHIQKYPSTADDSGTTKRNVQHLFTRVMSTLHTQVKVSDTQAALILLNSNMEMNSETFRYFGAEHSVNFLNYELEMAEKNTPLFSGNKTSHSASVAGFPSTNKDDESELDDSSVSSASLPTTTVVNTCDPADAFLQNSNGDRSFGLAPFWKVK